MVIDPVISISAILAVLLSVLLAHRLTVSRDEQKELRAAVAEFKDALASMLSNLTHPDANPNLLITSNYAEHKKAAIKLIQKLPPKAAKKFNAAWEKYHELHEEKQSLGLLGLFASEVTDMDRAHDPAHIREVNAQRCREVIAVLRNIVKSVDL